MGMRKRCEARADLEGVKADLLKKVSGTADNVLKTAQELLNPPMVDVTEEGAPEPVKELPHEDLEEIRALVQRAEELEGLATMASKWLKRLLISYHESMQSPHVLPMR